KPMMDIRGRGFQGFTTVRHCDPQRLMETTTVYDPYTRVTNTVHSALYYYPNANRPQSVTTVVPIVSADTESTIRKYCVGGLTSAACSQPARIRRTVNHDQLSQLNSGASYIVQPATGYTSEWEQTINIDLGGANGAPFNTQHTDDLHLWGTLTEPATPLRRVDRSFGFDDFGNLIHEVSATQNGVRAEMSISYDHSSDRIAAWLNSLPLSYSVTTTEPNGIATTRTTNYHSEPLGQLDTIYAELGNPDADIPETITLGYDNSNGASGYGLLTSVTQSAPNSADGTVTPTRQTHIEYTPACTANGVCAAFAGQPDERVYATQIWTSHDSAAYQPSQSTLNHPAYGPIAGMDANGVQSTAQLDDLGRAVLLQSAGQAAAGLRYAGRPDAFCTSCYNGIVTTASRGNEQATTMVDAGGRLLQQAATAFDAVHGRTISQRQYDALGRLARVSQWYFELGGQPAYTTYRYDTLDRALEVVRPDATRTCHQYTFFESRRWNVDATHACSMARDNESYTTTDVDGRVIDSANVLFNPQTQAKSELHTRFSYAPFNLLQSVFDPLWTTGDESHVTRMSYDIRGRRKTLTEPDRGTTETYYNGLGDVRREVKDAAGEATTFTHDDLGRLLSADGPGVEQRSYVWDTSANGIGQMAS